MTDAEILCEFMEPRPELPNFYSHLQQSRLLWWVLGPVQHGGMKWYPRDLTLDAIWEIEERLIDEQWERYEVLLRDPANRRHLKSMIHATAEQKTTALAAVLRPVVEAGVQQ